MRAHVYCRRSTHALSCLLELLLRQRKKDRSRVATAAATAAAASAPSSALMRDEAAEQKRAQYAMSWRRILLLIMAVTVHNVRNCIVNFNIKNSTLFRFQVCFHRFSFHKQTTTKNVCCFLEGLAVGVREIIACRRFLAAKTRILRILSQAEECISVCEHNLKYKKSASSTLAAAAMRTHSHVG